MSTQAHSPTVGGGDRLVAGISLACLPAAVAIVAVGAINNVEGVLLALAGIALVIAGGWYAVSRRGGARTAGIVAALAGLCVLVAALVIADLSWWRILSAVVLGVVATGTARSALERADAPDPASLGSPVPAAAHATLIMNPVSGGGKATRFHVADECARRGIEAIVLNKGDDLVQLAEDAVARGTDVIGMAGGDGSQALVADVARRHGIPLVVIPAGTRNHFALDLGLDREDVVGALDAFGEAVERTIDLATVNGRVFVNNASLGIYARIVQSPEYRDAKLRTAAAMLPDILGPDAEPFGLRYLGADGEEHDEAQMILVSNNPYQMDDLDGRGTRERIDLGVVGVVAARIGSAVDAEQFAALNAIGQLRRFHGWDEWTARRFQIDSDRPVEIGIDGESLTIDPPLVFETMPAALRIRLPRHAGGRSPAARRISSSTPGRLWRIAVSGDPRVE
jgi:diacylglycerol kinase family enzyme